MVYYLDKMSETALDKLLGLCWVAMMVEKMADESVGLKVAQMVFW